MKHDHSCVRGDDKPMPWSRLPTQGDLDKSLAGEAAREDLNKGYTDKGGIGRSTRSDAPDFA